jgi:hypothetical protein
MFRRVDKYPLVGSGRVNPRAQNDLKIGRSGLIEAVTQVKRDIFDYPTYDYGATFY